MKHLLIIGGGPAGTAAATTAAARGCRVTLVEKSIVDGFAFDVELLFLAQRYGLSLREVPVTWRNAEGSKVGLIGDPLDMLKDLVRVRWKFRRGGYNLESDAVLPS